jgi:hypothetical protein
LIIFVIDILSLKEISPKLLVIDLEFKVEEIRDNQINAHPDIKPGLKIKSIQSTNKYVGSSNLCCCTCC